MQVYMVVIVYEDRSVIIDSVYANFDTAESRCEAMRNDYRNMPHSRVSFVYTTKGYMVQQ